MTEEDENAEVDSDEEGFNDSIFSGKPLDLSRLLRIGWSLSNTFSQMSGAGVVHLDIKPDNVMVTSTGDVIITDFGCSLMLNKKMEAELAQDSIVGGNILHLSPEIRRKSMKKRMVVNFEKQAQFELGVLLFEVAFGRHPIKEYGTEVNYSFSDIEKLPTEYPETVRDIVNHLVHPDGDKRPTLKRAIEVFSTEMAIRNSKIETPAEDIRRHAFQKICRDLSLGEILPKGFIRSSGQCGWLCVSACYWFSSFGTLHGFLENSKKIATGFYIAYTEDLSACGNERNEALGKELEKEKHFVNDEPHYYLSLFDMCSLARLAQVGMTIIEVLDDFSYTITNTLNADKTYTDNFVCVYHKSHFELCGGPFERGGAALPDADILRKHRIPDWLEKNAEGQTTCIAVGDSPSGYPKKAGEWPPTQPQETQATPIARTKGILVGSLLEPTRNGKESKDTARATKPPQEDLWDGGPTDEEVAAMANEWLPCVPPVLVTEFGGSHTPKRRTAKRLDYGCAATTPPSDVMRSHVPPITQNNFEESKNVDDQPEPAPNFYGGRSLINDQPQYSREDQDIAGAATKLLLGAYGMDKWKPGQLETVVSSQRFQISGCVAKTGGGKTLMFLVSSMLTRKKIANGGGRDSRKVPISLLCCSRRVLCQQHVSVINSATPGAACYLESNKNANNPNRMAALAGKYHTVALNPETLLIFVKALCEYGRCVIADVTFDEAHSILDFSDDFRAIWLELHEIWGVIEEKQARPSVALFSATWPKEMQDRVLEVLKIKHWGQANILRFPLHRPNLELAVQLKNPMGVGKLTKTQLDFEVLLDGVLQAQSRGNKSQQLIYFNETNELEQCVKYFKDNGVCAVAYHSQVPKLSRTERDVNIEMWLRGSARVLCATDSYGPGCHNKNVNFVGMCGLPRNLEQMEQQRTRGGRNGQPSKGLVLWSALDLKHLLSFIADLNDQDQKRHEQKRLKSMLAVIGSTTCRVRRILKYLGDDTETTQCGNCDVCKDKPAGRIVTREALHLLGVVLNSGSRGICKTKMVKMAAQTAIGHDLKTLVDGFWIVLLDYLTIEYGKELLVHSSFFTSHVG